MPYSKPEQVRFETKSEAPAIVIETAVGANQVDTQFGKESPDFFINWHGEKIALFVRNMSEFPYNQYFETPDAYFEPAVEGEYDDQVWFDASLPRKYWEIIALHEIIELEEKKKETHPGLKSPHRIAMHFETNFARKQLGTEGFREYLRWKKQHLKRAYKQTIEEKRGRNVGH